MDAQGICDSSRATAGAAGIVGTNDNRLGNGDHADPATGAERGMQGGMETFVGFDRGEPTTSLTLTFTLTDGRPGQTA